MQFRSKLLVALQLLAQVLLADDLYAFPYELSYGGRLTEASGKPVEGPVNLRLAFYRSNSNFDAVPVIVPDFNGLALVDGIFQVTIILSPTEFHTAFNDSDSLWIQVTDLSHNVVYPRQKFSFVPYALKVPVNGETLTWTSEGKLSVGKQSKLDLKSANTDYAISLKAPNSLEKNQVFVLPASPGTAGQVLKTDGAGNWLWQTLSGGGDLLGANNLSDLASASSARANLGLGTAAVKNIGNTAADVAVGNHGHSASQITDFNDAVAAAPAVIAKNSYPTGDAAKVNNITVTSSTNLDSIRAIINTLGDAASKNVGNGSTNVAAGNHSHPNATAGSDGMMSAADKAKLDGIASGAGSGLSALNGQSGASQTFALGVSGTEPAWSSATNTHTLNLPLASAANVSAGLISKVDYDSFAAKQSNLGFTPANAAGTTFTGNVILDVPGPATANAVEIRNSQKLQFKGDQAAPNSISFRAPSGVFSNQSYVLPSANPTSGQVLQSDGSGNLSWWTPGNTLTSLAQLTVSCTAGQVIKSNGAGSWSCQSDNDSAGANGLTPADASVSTVKIVDGAVTAAKLNAMGCSNGQILKSNGTTWTCSADDNNYINSNASLLTTGTLPDARLSANVSLLGSSIDTAELANGAVTNAKLGAGAVTAGNLGAGAVGTEAIADGAVTASKLAGSIPDSALSTISTPGKVSGSAITSGTITANLNGTATNVSGIVATANGGTGANGASLAANLVLASPSSGSGAASYRALTSADMPAGLASPVGQVITMLTATCPSGYLEANGAAVSRATYAQLFTSLGISYGSGDGSTTFTLPDLRGYFLRGWDHGRGSDPDAASRLARADGTSGDNVGTTQSDTYASHTHVQNAHSHTGSTATAGSHSHTTSADGNHAHSGSTSTDGNHNHGVSGFGVGGAGGGYWILACCDDGPNTAPTKYAGSHAHSLNINAAGSHGHTISTDSGHTHTVTVNSATATNQAAGNNETRPKNINVLYCIKY